MKNKFIKDLQSGERIVNEQFAVKNIRQGKTANGRTYLDLTLSDRTGEINAKIWESNLSNCEEITVGEVAELSADVEEFRDKQQLNISFLQKAAKFNLSDFLRTTDKDIEELWKSLLGFVKKIKDKNIQKLLDNFILDKELAAKFKQAPAAELIHHAYIGGLLEHVVEMLNLAETVCRDYPKMNRDLLICGVLLHDIGKLDELAVDHTIYRTTEGNLIGHLSLGVLRVDKVLGQIADFPETLRLKIINMILGHHEKLEFGSPVKPMTREAVALAFIDNLSAKVNNANAATEASEGSEAMFTDKIYSLDTKLFLG